MDCPYYERKDEDGVCGASLTRLHPSDEEVRACCTTEGHDGCALLLAHLLRQGYRHETRSGTARGRAVYMSAA